MWNLDLRPLAWAGQGLQCRFADPGPGQAQPGQQLKTGQPRRPPRLPLTNCQSTRRQCWLLPVPCAPVPRTRRSRPDRLGIALEPGTHAGAPANRGASSSTQRQGGWVVPIRASADRCSSLLVPEVRYQCRYICNIHSNLNQEVSPRYKMSVPLLPISRTRTRQRTASNPGNLICSPALRGSSLGPLRPRRGEATRRARATYGGDYVRCNGVVCPPHVRRRSRTSWPGAEACSLRCACLQLRDPAPRRVAFNVPSPRCLVDPTAASLRPV